MKNLETMKKFINKFLDTKIFIDDSNDLDDSITKFESFLNSIKTNVNDGVINTIIEGISVLNEDVDKITRREGSIGGDLILQRMSNEHTKYLDIIKKYGEKWIRKELDKKGYLQLTEEDKLNLTDDQKKDINRLKNKLLNLRKAKYMNQLSLSDFIQDDYIKPISELEEDGADNRIINLIKTYYIFHALPRIVNTIDKANPHEQYTRDAMADMLLELASTKMVGHDDESDEYIPTYRSDDSKLNRELGNAKRSSNNYYVDEYLLKNLNAGSEYYETFYDWVTDEIQNVDTDSSVIENIKKQFITYDADDDMKSIGAILRKIKNDPKLSLSLNNYLMKKHELSQNKDGDASFSSFLNPEQLATNIHDEARFKKRIQSWRALKNFKENTYVKYLTGYYKPTKNYINYKQTLTDFVNKLPEQTELRLNEPREVVDFNTGSKIKTNNFGNYLLGLFEKAIDICTSNKNSLSNLKNTDDSASLVYDIFENLGQQYEFIDEVFFAINKLSTPPIEVDDVWKQVTQDEVRDEFLPHHQSQLMTSAGDDAYGRKGGQLRDVKVDEQYAKTYQHNFNASNDEINYQKPLLDISLILNTSFILDDKIKPFAAFKGSNTDRSLFYYLSSKLNNPNLNYAYFSRFVEDNNILKPTTTTQVNKRRNEILSDINAFDKLFSNDAVHHYFSEHDINVVLDNLMSIKDKLSSRIEEGVTTSRNKGSFATNDFTNADSNVTADEKSLRYKYNGNDIIDIDDKLLINDITKAEKMFNNYLNEINIIKNDEYFKYFIKNKKIPKLTDDEYETIKQTTLSHSDVALDDEDMSI